MSAARVMDDVVKVATSPVGLIIAAVIGVVIIKNVAQSLFGKDGSFNPEVGATDAAGNPVTAYSDVGGPLGWIGAASNKASGGLLSSFGEWIGGQLGDITCNYNPNTVTPVIGDSTASTDPEIGVVFADRFRLPSTDPHAGSIPTSNQFREVSGSIQSWSARPYQGGNHAAYHNAYDSSRPDPAYTLNVLVNDPSAAYVGR